MNAAIEVCPGLYVGGAEALDEVQWRTMEGHDQWAIVHAARDPWHRALLGYSGRGCPPEHSEYRLAIRHDQMYLNLVDADSPRFFSVEVMEATLAFIDHWIRAWGRVLVHCNTGESRAPSIALLSMAVHGDLAENFLESVALFRAIYPRYAPRAGIEGHLRHYWDYYMVETRDLLERLSFLS